MLPLAFLCEPEQEDRCSRIIHTKPNTVNLCSRYSSSARLFLGALLLFSACSSEWKEVQRRVIQHHNSYTQFPTRESLWFRCRAAAGVSGGSLRPPSAWRARPTKLGRSGLLFSNDLLADKWCVTNFVIMQLVVHEKWHQQISQRWKMGEQDKAKKKSAVFRFRCRHLGLATLWHILISVSICISKYILA